MATNDSKPFLGGVVEGFYGRPWSTDQRIHLFTCMSRWSLNCYLYAPKDDDKHRSAWRDMYSLDEADHLAMLIKETRDRGVDFVYAIAPGLDITFSDDKEILTLKRKLQQVAQLGCDSFAILFDDIDPELSMEDSKVFSCSAQAQVSLVNEIHTSLGDTRSFLFCPTEYCGTRALPNVKESPYLAHIGDNLKECIDVMWTGPKVISKTIPMSTIEELITVIKRKPVIWDNLHANDYDQRRLFLGPYNGRSITLYNRLNGVLTNPNCEYGANFVAIHTLSQWIKIGRSFYEKKLEVELEEGMDTLLTEVTLYNPKEALEMALQEWIGEFMTDKRKTEDYCSRPAKSIKSVQRAMNEMEHDSKDDDIKDRSSSGDSSDMDTTPEALLDDSIDSPLPSQKNKDSQFSIQDLRVMVDLFYLPHAHGEKGWFLLDEFSWLKQHACDHRLMKKVISDDEEREENDRKLDKLKDDTQSDGEETEDNDSNDSYSRSDLMEVQQWLDRALQFHNLCDDINRCFDRLTSIPNRPLLYDLYQYMSDARESTMLLDSYISWLEAGGIEAHPKHQPHARMGGIVSEMLALLPNHDESAHLISKYHTFTIRPYKESDKEFLYQTCLETGNHGSDATLLFPNFPNLLGDRYVGAYLCYSADLSYVIEDNQGVCGYVLAALDSAIFYDQFRKDWLPQITSKYPLTNSKDTLEELVLSLLIICSLVEQSIILYFNGCMIDQLLQEIQSPQFFLPDSLYGRYPSHLHIDLMKRARGIGNGTKMMDLIMSLLKEKGSCGVHLEMSSKNKSALRFYLKIGFEILENLDETLILGKVL